MRNFISILMRKSRKADKPFKGNWRTNGQILQSMWQVSGEELLASLKVVKYPCICRREYPDLITVRWKLFPFSGVFYGETWGRRILERKGISPDPCNNKSSNWSAVLMTFRFLRIQHLSYTQWSRVQLFFIISILPFPVEYFIYIFIVFLHSSSFNDILSSFLLWRKVLQAFRNKIQGTFIM